MQRKELSFSGQKIFIGIDVHKDSWRVATVPEVGVVKRTLSETLGKKSSLTFFEEALS